MVLEKIERFDKLFIVASLFFMSGALLPLSAGDNTNVEAGGALSQIVFILIYFVTLIRINKLKGSIFKTFRLSNLLFILILLSFFSVLWSDEPFYTIRRGIGLAGTSIFGYYLACVCDINTACRLIFKALLIAAVLSFLTSTMLPSYGLMSSKVENGLYTGAWKGAFAHKNNLGAAMDLFILVCFYLYTLKRSSKYVLAMILAFVLIFMSRSTTALILPIIIIVIFYTLRISKFRFVNISILGGGLFYIIGTIIFDSEKLFTFIGKDATFTGRTFLWLEVIAAVKTQPILGFGYGAFWISGKNNLASRIWTEINWEAPHAHNGFLDLALQLGYLGCAIYIILFFKEYRNYLYMYTVKLKDQFAWGGLFMTLILVYNFMESNILRQNNVFWCLFIYTVIRYRMIDLKKYHL